MNEKQVEEALKDYHWIINEIKRQRELLEDAETSVVAQSGIESTLPKALGEISDPVAREVIRRDKKFSWVNKLEKKVLFIQGRVYLIKNEREKAVLECMLDGLSMIAISKHMGLSERHIYRLRTNIVQKMSGNAGLSGKVHSQKCCV